MGDQPSLSSTQSARLRRIDHPNIRSNMTTPHSNLGLNSVAHRIQNRPQFPLGKTISVYESGSFASEQRPGVQETDLYERHEVIAASTRRTNAYAYDLVEPSQSPISVRGPESISVHRSISERPPLSTKHLSRQEAIDKSLSLVDELSAVPDRLARINTAQVAKLNGVPWRGHGQNHPTGAKELSLRPALQQVDRAQARNYDHQNSVDRPTPSVRRSINDDRPTPSPRVSREERRVEYPLYEKVVRIDPNQTRDFRVIPLARPRVSNVPYVEYGEATLVGGGQFTTVRETDPRECLMLQEVARPITYRQGQPRVVQATDPRASIAPMKSNVPIFYREGPPSAARTTDPRASVVPIELERTSAMYHDGSKFRGGIKPPKFDGTGDLKHFLDTWTDVASHNEWSSDMSLRQLRYCLVGKAIPCGRQNTCREIFDSLFSRFGMSESKARTELDRIRRGTNQSLRELGDHIEHLVQVANPFLTQDQLCKSEIGAFSRALGDVELHRFLLSSRPRNLQEAMIFCEEYQATLPNVQPRRPVNQVEQKEVKTIPKSSVAQIDCITQSNFDHAIKGLKGEIVQAVKELIREPKSYPKSYPKLNIQPQPQADVNRRALVCFQCGEEGHFKRDCTRSDRGDRRPSQRPTSAGRQHAPNVPKSSQQRSNKPLN